jgi:hypothetical protein
MRCDVFLTVDYFKWERFLANRHIDRVISKREERAAVALAELLYLLRASDMLAIDDNI